jgi:hypothetical protein
MKLRYRIFAGVRILNLPDHLNEQNAGSLFELFDDPPLTIDGRSVATFEVTKKTRFSEVMEVIRKYEINTDEMDLFVSFRSESDTGIFNFPGWICPAANTLGLRVTVSYTIC